MIRILIVDDENLMRQAVSLTLSKEEDFEVVGVAKDGNQALLKTKELKPDIIVMDINMPGMNGFEATKAILRHYPGIKIINFSGNEIDSLPAITNGAKSYLPKSNGTSRQLVERIRWVYYELNRSSFKAVSQLNTLSAIEVNPLDNVSFSSLDSRDLEIINAEFQTLGCESNTDTLEQDRPFPTHKNDRSLDIDLDDLPDLEPNSYYKSKLEEVIALLKRQTDEYKLKHQEIVYSIQNSEQKKENLLHQINATLQKRLQDNSQHYTYHERQLTQFNNRLLDLRKQIQLMVKLCIIIVFLAVFSLISLTIFAIVWT